MWVVDRGVRVGLRSRMGLVSIWLLASLCAFGAEAEPGIFADPGRIGVLSYGIYCIGGGEIVAAPETATGEIRDGGLYDWKAETLRVPARLGLAFGLVFEVRDGFGPAMIRTTHPPFEGREITSYRRVELFVSPTEGDRNMMYGFDYSFELAPGTWLFEIEAADGSVIRAEFEVVTDDGTLFPEVQCPALPMS